MNKTIYLLLTDTGSLFTKLIKLYTKRPYNHASICLDANFENVYSFGRKRSNNPLIGGFVKEDIHKGIFLNADCAIYRCTVTEKQYERICHMIENIAKYQDFYRYNLLGIIAIALNIKLERKNAFFCSEFVATLLTISGITEFTKPLTQITPYDLQLINNFQLIYSGSLAVYRKNMPQTINLQTANMTLL